MSESNKIKWLLQQIATWEREKILDAQNAERLRARYAALPAGTHWRQALLGSLGALLVGLGVIALLAANWADLSRGVRTVLAFLPLAACVAAWAAGQRKGWNSIAFNEPLGIFWSLAIGAGISLIAQTYHISGSPETFALSWTLLLLPVMLATRSVGSVAGYFIGLAVWAGIMRVEYDNTLAALGCWPLAALAAPLLVWMRRNDNGVRLTLMRWGAVVSAYVAVGFMMDEHGMMWKILFTSAFASLLLAGWLWEDRGVSIWKTPMRTLGGAGLAVLLYNLIFEVPWDIDRHSFTYGLNDGIAMLPLWQGVLHLARWFGLPLLACALFARVVWQQNKAQKFAVDFLAWPVSAAVVGLLTLMTFQEDGLEVIAAWVMTGWVFALGVLTLMTGVKTRAMGRVNMGVLVLLAVIVGKFFSSELSFTVKGIVFIACGAGFFAMNHWASKRMKKEGGAE